jgi:hypothetical protein
MNITPQRRLISAMVVLVAIVAVVLARGCLSKAPFASVPPVPSQLGDVPAAAAPPMPIPSSPKNPAAVQQAKFATAFAAPITFYGKVIDQNGAPVSGASVDMQANNTAWRSGKPYHTIANAQGEFSISGSTGLSLYVKVSKPGYHRVLTRGGKPGSDGGFAYGTNLGDGIHHPDPQKPAVFVLQKPGVLEPLLRIDEIRKKVGKNGEALRLSLDDGSHTITIQCWTDDANPTAQRRYDWRFRVSVPGGGMAPREGTFAFEAPVDGYRPSVEHAMSKDLPDGQWKDSVEKSYFVRFSDNVHARIDVRVIAHGAHFVVFSGYLNPKVGSRNLESDPAQE